MSDYHAWLERQAEDARRVARQEHRERVVPHYEPEEPVKNLYMVQDNDGPMWIAAESWQQAIDYWKCVVASENDCNMDELDEPDGITLVCKSDDLILTDPFKA